MQNRRDFIRTSIAGTTGALIACRPRSKGAGDQATAGPRSIKDVKHVVILMQENRSFDHYFGTMKGVRGFGDRHPIPLENGKPVWHQSDGDARDPPFRLDSEE